MGGGGGGGAYFLVKFRLFSKLFGSCFKIVWALFLDSEGLHFRVVSAQKKISIPPKSTFLGEILAIFSKLVPVIWPFWGPKKSLFDFLNVVLELFRSGLGIIFGIKMPTFSCIFSSKGRYMTSKIKIVCQKFALGEGHFDHFGVQKSRFLDFLKVVLELFRSYFGIVLGLKWPTFRCIYSSKGRYMTSKIKI